MNAKCEARTRKGTPCQYPAGYRTPHAGFGRCRYHGGTSPSGNTAGHRAMAADSVRTLGLPIDVNPIDAIVAELARGFGAIAWLQEQVGAVPPDKFNDPLPRALIRQLNEERDRNARVAAEALRLGLEAKATAIKLSTAQTEGDELAALVLEVLADPVLGLTDAQVRHARRAIARAFLRDLPHPPVVRPEEAPALIELADRRLAELT